MQRKELVKADESKRRTELADEDLARRLQKQEEKWSHRRDDRSRPHEGKGKGKKKKKTATTTMRDGRTKQLDDFEEQKEEREGDGIWESGRRKEGEGEWDEGCMGKGGESKGKKSRRNKEGERHRDDQRRRGRERERSCDDERRGLGINKSWKRGEEAEFMSCDDDRWEREGQISLEVRRGKVKREQDSDEGIGEQFGEGNILTERKAGHRFHGGKLHKETKKVQNTDDAFSHKDDLRCRESCEEEIGENLSKTQAVGGSGHFGTASPSLGAFEDRFTRLQVVQDKDSWKGTKAGADMEKGEVGRKEPEKGDVKRDAELARQLQAEEEKQAREVRKVRVKDEQMARFAQDEEIARYIQQKEIKSNKEREADSGPENCDVREPGRRAYRHCLSDGESCSPRGSVERSGRKKDGEMAGYVDMTRKDHGLQSRTGGNVWWDPQSQRQEKPPRPPPPKNIAEDLDPTFHTSSAARHVPALSTNYKDEEREVERGPRARCTEGESRSASAARGDGKGNGKKESCKQQ
uniref:Uncharacterized protein n=1 Tax=Eptatretus burgeri TaxID=7764 RepID=A0A8C4QRQ6_EPTBU